MLAATSVAVALRQRPMRKRPEESEWSEGVNAERKFTAGVPSMDST
jgi:hypothetical protein